jgi:hypothetical protein
MGSLREKEVMLVGVVEVRVDAAGKLKAQKSMT